MLFDGKVRFDSTQTYQTQQKLVKVRRTELSEKYDSRNR